MRRHFIQFLAALLALLLFAPPAHADPVTAIVLIAQGVAAAGGIAAIGLTAAMATYIAIGASVVGGIMARRKAARAAAAARAAQRESLQERTVVLSSSEPSPQVVYGRATVGGAVLDRLSSPKTIYTDGGETKTKPDALQHVIIGIACHEITDVHRVHMCGEWLTWDGVTKTVGGSYAKTGASHVTVPVTFNSSGAGTIPGVPASVTISKLLAATQTDAAGITTSHPLPALSGTALSGFPANSTWDITYEATTKEPAVRVEWYPGTDAQSASAYLMSVAPGRWTSAHQLKSIAYVVLTLDLDDARFQNGLPNDLAFDVSGRPVLDPRTGATAWSDNTALVLYDWMRSPWGYGLTADDIDTPSVISAADACDAIVPHPTSSNPSATGKFSRFAGSFKAGDDRDGIRGDMAENMGGFVVPGAQWSIHAGTWSAPVMTLTDRHLAAPLQILRTATPHDEAFNSARATIIPEGKRDTEDVDPYSNAVFVADDGGLQWQTFTLPFCPRKTQARNLLRQFVEQARLGQVISYLGSPELWPLEAGDRVVLQDSEHVIDATYRVIEVNKGPGMPVSLVLQEDIAANYDAADATQADPAPNSGLPPPGTVEGPVLGMPSSGNAELIRHADGTVLPRVLVSWQRPTSLYMQSPSARTEVSWRRVGDDAWIDTRLPGGEERTYLSGMREGDVVIIAARHVNSIGVASSWVSTAHTVIGKSAPPTAPTALAVTEAVGGQRIYALAHTPDIDHAGYLVRYSASLVASFAGMTDVAAEWSGVGRVGQSSLPPDGTWLFAVVAVDSSGNYSEPVYTTATLTGIARATSTGGSGNQLFNGDFGLGWRGWDSISSGVTATRAANLVGWTIKPSAPISGDTVAIVQGAPVGNSEHYAEEWGAPVPVIPLGWYCASAYTGAHQCRGIVFAFFFDAAGVIVGNTHGLTSENDGEAVGGADLGGYKRVYGTGQAPAIARTARLVLRKYDTKPGHASSHLFACRAMFEPVDSVASTPSPWSPGPSGYTGDLDATRGAPENTMVGSTLAQHVESISGAQAKADAAHAAAILAAENYTNYQNTLLEVEAKAYADGIVSAEEARAIADATARANAARIAAEAAAAADATAKANVAATTALWTGVSDRPAEQANLCWNGAGPGLAGWSSGVTIQDWGTTGYWAVSMGLTGSRYALTFQQRDSTFGDAFVVRKDEVYSFGADCVKTGAVAGGYSTSIGLILFSADGTLLAGVPAASLASGAVNGNLSGTVTIPAGAAKAVVWVLVDGSSNFTTAGNGAHYTNIVVRRAATTNDLVRGSATSVVNISGNITSATGSAGSISGFGTGWLPVVLNDGDKIEVTLTVTDASANCPDPDFKFFFDTNWCFSDQSLSTGRSSQYTYKRHTIQVPVPAPISGVGCGVSAFTLKHTLESPLQRSFPEHITGLRSGVVSLSIAGGCYAGYVNPSRNAHEIGMTGNYQVSLVVIRR